MPGLRNVGTGEENKRSPTDLKMGRINNYSGDLNSELVRYSNGPKQFARQMVRYSSHGLNSELIFRYSDHRVFD